jgi:ATP-dependent Clp protease ATP-binding subunit ClpC
MWRLFKKPPPRKPTEPEFAPELAFALGLAREEAKQRRTLYLGPEHLLLGVLAAEGSAGASILDRLGVARDRLQIRIHRYLDLRGVEAAGDEYALSPRGRRVFEHMYQEAARLGAAQMGTEHLLLGIVHEGDSLAARLLIGAGADLETLRRAADRSRELVPAAAPAGSGREPAAAPETAAEG